ncbi:cold-shock protein [Streptomyces sp. NPDC096032]|uniref:cold-shock protein n=1 Tax=Streptomyces sp. NPDC096032 TaxID=3366070 RepID=UPI0038152CFF
MATAMVKWFNAEKGFGLISPDDGEPNIYAHRSAVNTAVPSFWGSRPRSTTTSPWAPGGPRPRTSPSSADQCRPAVRSGPPNQNATPLSCRTRRPGSPSACPRWSASRVGGRAIRVGVGSTMGR